MMVHHSSFTKRSLCFVHHRSDYTACVYAKKSKYNDASTAKTKCKCNSEGAYVVSFFCSVNISPCPERFFFKSLKNSKELLLFGSNIQIFEISPCVSPSLLSRLFNKYLSFYKY